MDNAVWKPSINPWLMIVPVILAAFICILDTIVGNVALPHIAGAFSASRDLKYVDFNRLSCCSRNCYAGC